MESYERWKIVPGFPLYEVSNSGKIRSIDRTLQDVNGRVLHYKQKERRTMINNKGYAYVSVKQNGKPVKLYIHRAVALAFIDNPCNKPCVNHIDNNPLNNNVENLEWCTKQENTDWMVVQGRNKRDKHWLMMQEQARRKTYKPVIATDLIDGRETIYDRLNGVKADGYSPGNVFYYIRAKRPYKGKMWRYLYEEQQAEDRRNAQKN